METLHFERYEWKYFVPEAWADAVRRFIAPYVRLDDHAARSPDRRYAIHGIYLDSPTRALWRASVDDQPARFKLRVRWYDEAARGPFFCEVKRKVRQVIVKTRAKVDRAAVLELLRGRPVAVPEGRTGEYLAGFQDRAARLGAEPILRMRYTREAYESVFGEYARITFDRAMCYQDIGADPLQAEPRAWRYVDAPVATDAVRSAMLIELKFTRRFPRWMTDLVTRFGLERCGFSKYVHAVAGQQARQAGGVELQRVAGLGR